MKKKILAAVLAIILVFGLLFFLKGCSDRSDSKTSSGVQTIEQVTLPTSGTVEIDDVEWYGIVCSPTMDTVAEMLTKDVVWQVRLDKDDKRVFTLYPSSWNTRAEFPPKGVTLEARVKEWRIAPGQRVRKGSVAWWFEPPQQPSAKPAGS